MIYIRSTGKETIRSKTKWRQIQIKERRTLALKRLLLAIKRSDLAGKSRIVAVRIRILTAVNCFIRMAVICQVLASVECRILVIHCCIEIRMSCIKKKMINHLLNENLQPIKSICKLQSTNIIWMNLNK